MSWRRRRPTHLHGKQPPALLCPPCPSAPASVAWRPRPPQGHIQDALGPEDAAVPQPCAWRSDSPPPSPAGPRCQQTGRAAAASSSPVCGHHESRQSTGPKSTLRGGDSWGVTQDRLRHPEGDATSHGVQPGAHQQTPTEAVRWAGCPGSGGHGTAAPRHHSRRGTLVPSPAWLQQTLAETGPPLSCVLCRPGRLAWPLTPGPGGSGAGAWMGHRRVSGPRVQ